MSSQEAVVIEHVEERPREFGFSSLFSALGKMWRGTGPALITIIVNALIQSLLIYWNAAIGLNAAYIVSLVVSIAAFLVAFALLSRTALESVSGRARVGSVFSSTGSVLPGFVLWVGLFVVAITIGMMINTVVGWLVAVLGAFLPLAAADGQRNAVGANFRAIKDRWGRWLITAIIITVLVVVLFLLSAVNVLFVKGFPASLIAWLAYGLLAWWWLTAWAEIYRSTSVGATVSAEDE